MIEKENYNLTVYINNVDSGIGAEEFVSFIITENLNYGCWFAELSLKQNVFWDAISTTTENIRVEITYKELTFEGSSSLTSKTYDMMVMDYKMFVDSVVFTLTPIYFVNLYRDKNIIGYNDKIENIVKKVCNSAGIKEVEVETTSAEKRLLIQMGESNFKFLKTITKYADNYIFFINKNNRAVFLPYSKFIREKKSNYQIHSLSMSNIKLENNTYNMQLMGGMGATNYYFDWDNGNMIRYNLRSNGYGVVTNDITEKNNILMGNPIGQKIYPSNNYNQNETKNVVNSKNLFKIFVQFDLTGIFDMVLGDTVRLLFSNKMDFNLLPTLTGDYFIYGISHIFANQYTTHMVCTTPFLFMNIDNFTGKNIPPGSSGASAVGVIV